MMAMDEETRQEFRHVRENFQKTFNKLDESQKTLQGHILEDSQNFMTLGKQIELMAQASEAHDRESGQRVKTQRARIDAHLEDHSKARALLMKILVPVIVAVLLGAGATAWNAFSTASDVQKVLMEMKKQNGNNE